MSSIAPTELTDAHWRALHELAVEAMTHAYASELTRTGGGRLVAFACVDAHGRALAPCGRCRQLLSEHAADGMVLAMPSGMMSIDEVLPDRFTSDDVERVVGQHR